MLGFASFVLLTLAASTASASTPVESPRAAQQKRQLFEDAADGRLDDVDLLDACLIASGVRSPDRQQACRRLFERHVHELAGRVGATMSPAQVAECAFEYLHQRVLQGHFEVDCSWPATSLETGNYNCLSATLLYLCLCRTQGLEFQAVAYRGHIACRFPGDAGFYVESTCPDWFQRGLHLSDESVLKNRQSAARPLDDVQLVAKVYYNRGVVLANQQAFGASLEQFRLSLRLDPSDLAARENRLAVLNNWALAEAERGEFPRAVNLIQEGLALDADYQPFRVNDLHIHQQWVKQLCHAGEYQRALEKLEAAYRRRPDARLFDEGRQAVQQKWLQAQRERSH